MAAESTGAGILRIRVVDDQNDDGLDLYMVEGFMAPNSYAFLIPFVWDGRARFVLVDSIIKVRSTSDGYFFGMIAIPENYQLLQVQFTTGRANSAGRDRLRDRDRDLDRTRDRERDPGPDRRVHRAHRRDQGPAPDRTRDRVPDRVRNRR
jgi:hypothetical protein